MVIMVLEQIFHKNCFLTSFRLEVFFSCLWVDVKELVGSVFLGKWLYLCLHLMYESHERNSIGCGYLSPCQILWVMYFCKDKGKIQEKKTISIRPERSHC